MKEKKYNVYVEYWNGGHRELVNGEPVGLEKAQHMQKLLGINSISEEYFAVIEEVHND